LPSPCHALYVAYGATWRQTADGIGVIEANSTRRIVKLVVCGWLEIVGIRGCVKREHQAIIARISSDA